MSLTNGLCPVCKKDAKYLPINHDDDRFYYCHQCGDYYIPGNCARYLVNSIEYPDMVELMRTRSKDQIPCFSPNFQGTTHVKGVNFHLPPDTRQK
ncbi:hypothetical protein ACQR7C_10200 [Salmonella enterica]|uniref:hypothetical protein n=1 Tax=Salmonella enterica TaxID=28901 RepID=UPI00127C2B83|nr:hypothetical protein [Salmonella enterica]EBL5124850.1 hypothetical protein [Salmonella enterica subsp. enterica serovar Rubislaw]EDV3147916.1 hypothetical protein [Salmonella enterica subsp. enterica serovar Chandans]EAY4680120.1 hypothetical protein [Salmonella enterica]EDB2828272.1 hypothetical protein [Salmonella enterica]